MFEINKKEKIIIRILISYLCRKLKIKQYLYIFKSFCHKKNFKYNIIKYQNAYKTINIRKTKGKHYFITKQ